MTDLSFILNRTIQKLDNISVQRTSYAKYLSISELGHPCSRYLWYIFRNYLPKPPVSGRTQRIFDTGNAQEQRIVAGLQRFALVGNCQAEVTACNGHLKGYIDAEILGIPEAPKTVHIAEFKSMNDKQFKATKEDGVQKHHFKHFVQFQVYGYLRELTRYFYLAINKNDEDVFMERGDIDEQFAKAQIDKAQRIINATTPPERIGKIDSMDCRWCPAKEICHNGAQHDVNYRNDGTMKPGPEGYWVKV